MDLDVAEVEMYFVNVVTAEPKMDEKDDSLEAEYMAWKEQLEAARLKRGRSQ
jgi:hypothetical protein